MQPDENLIISYKVEYCNWCLTLALSILMFAIVVGVILSAYHPDIQKALDFALKTVIHYGLPVAPDPTKRLLYLAALAVFFVTIPGFYFLTNRYLIDIVSRKIRFLYPAFVFASIAGILFLTYSALAAPNPYYAENAQNFHDHASKTNVDFYFVSTFIYDHFIWYVLLLFPAIMTYLLFNQKIPRKTGERIAGAGRIVSYVFCAAIIVVVFFISSFKFPYSVENKYDFNNVFYSVVQVCQGTPMLVDHFMNTYGLYPHFVAPLMKIFGLSVLSFSSIMGLLISLCFLFMLVFLTRTVTNWLLVLFGFTTVFFISYAYGPSATPYFDPYFANAPIRWMMPFSLLLYAVLYLNKRSRFLYFFSFIYFPLGILWCPDFGMASFFDLLAFYAYLEFESNDFIRVIRKTALHGLLAILGVAVTFSAYAIAIKIFYGKVPDLSGLFSTIRVESFIGRGMLPLPTTFHPWMIVVLIYLAGLQYSTYSIFNKRVSSHAAAVFLITMIGISSFPYYLGRSHNWNLVAISPWCFLLLTIFADDLLKIVNKRKLFIAPFALAIFILSMSVFQTVYACQPILALMSDKEDKERNRGEQERITGNAAFIRGLTQDKEKVMIFSADLYQGLYYELSNTAAAVNPGLEDLRLITDYERIQSFLINNDTTKIFFDPGSFRFCDPGIPLILSSLYDVSKVGPPPGSIMLLGRRKENPGSNFMLTQDYGSIVHELFDKTFAKRLSYAAGNGGAIALGKSFSVEVIFRPVEVPSSPYTDCQSVFSNMQGDSGMALAQKGSDNSVYVFSHSGSGIEIPVMVGKWNYLACIVDSSRIYAYANGCIVGAARTTEPYHNSASPLFIGNFGLQGGFFFGDIKELKISNNLYNPRELSNTWDKVKNIVE